jgi:hypothetical protein
MQIRWWNSFNVLAVILFAIGIIGAFSAGRMVFDPGRAQTGKEWIIYLVAGGLMLVNGLLPSGTPQSPQDHHHDAPGKSGPPVGETPAGVE